MTWNNPSHSRNKEQISGKKCHWSDKQEFLKEEQRFDTKAEVLLKRHAECEVTCKVFEHDVGVTGVEHDVLLYVWGWGLKFLFLYIILFSLLQRGQNYL